jgi:hypothetical protein
MNFLLLPREIQETIFNKIPSFQTRFYLNLCMPDNEKFELRDIDKTFLYFETTYQPQQPSEHQNYISVNIPVNHPEYQHKLIIRKKIGDCKPECRCYDVVCEVKKYKVNNKLTNHIISNMNLPS